MRGALSALLRLARGYPGTGEMCALGKVANQ